MFSTSCKQGKLQLTEDGYLEVSSMVSGQSWREHVSAIRGISFKPGLMASCGFIVFAQQAHLVTMVVRKHFDQFCELLPHIPITEVPELRLPPAPPPAQPLSSYHAPYPPAEIAPQAYAQPMQPVSQQPPAAPQMETVVKIYKKPQEYQHDLKRMQRRGWSVQNTLDHHKDRSLAYKALVPFGAFSGGTGQIVVTYQRPKR